MGNESYIQYFSNYLKPPGTCASFILRELIHPSISAYTRAVKSAIALPNPHVLTLIEHNGGRSQHMLDMTDFCRAKGVFYWMHTCNHFTAFPCMYWHMTGCAVQQNGCFVASTIPATYQEGFFPLRIWQQRPTFVSSVTSFMEKAAVYKVSNE